MINLSLVIPVFNEDSTIKKLIEETKLYCEKSDKVSDYEIIIVDDNSSDETNKIVNKIDNVILIKNLNNFGYGYSLKKGIESTKFDNIAILDGDGTYPIEYLNELIDVYNEGYDLVIAKRIGKNLNLSPFKKPMRLLLKFIVEFATGYKIPDINSGYRIIKKNKILSKLKHLSDAFSFTTSMTMSFIYSKHSIAYVDVPYALRDQKSGSKVRLLKDSLRTLQFILKIVLLYDRIKLFVLISFFQLIIFIPLIILSIFNSIFLIPSVLIFISTVICFCIGMLSETFKKNDK